MKKFLEQNCLTQTYTKTSHMTLTLYIKIWALCLFFTSFLVSRAQLAHRHTKTRKPHIVKKKTPTEVAIIFLSINNSVGEGGHVMCYLCKHFLTYFNLFLFYLLLITFNFLFLVVGCSFRPKVPIWEVQACSAERWLSKDRWKLHSQATGHKISIVNLIIRRTKCKLARALHWFISDSFSL